MRKVTDPALIRAVLTEEKKRLDGLLGELEEMGKRFGSVTDALFLSEDFLDACVLLRAAGSVLRIAASNLEDVLNTAPEGPMEVGRTPDFPEILGPKGRA